MNEFWSLSFEEIFKNLNTSYEGLDYEEVEKRLNEFGPNTIRKKKNFSSLRILISQFQSPLILLLLICAILAYFLADPIDSVIILGIVVISALLGFIQENRAMFALNKLLEIVQVSAHVKRKSHVQKIHVEAVVPGDILYLKAGDIVPADCLLLEVHHFFVNESTLTGESLGVEKEMGILPTDTPLHLRKNSLFMGSYVMSGTAVALAVHTGKNTCFGKIASQMDLSSAKTSFDYGIHHFGYFLVQITFFFIIAVFAINVYFKRPIIDSFLFALSLGVGFTPQLLPAIITLNLSRGAKYLADKKVIVKKLAAIEDFGSMDVLCCDKTGTLTKGVVELLAYHDVHGQVSNKTLLYATINASLQAGYPNPIDQSILSAGISCGDWQKLDELPFDFSRKRITFLAKKNEETFLITKGAFQSILSICSKIETSDGDFSDIHSFIPALNQFLQTSSEEGCRLVAVAYSPMPNATSFTQDNEKNLIFLGYLKLADPIKEDAIDSLERLKHLGINVKIISGDNELIVSQIAKQVGLTKNHVLTGSDLIHLSEIQLQHEVKKHNVFAELDPLQKERVIVALRKTGHTVGFLGDGINDAIAMRSADVGISVDNATEVAKEAADFICLEKHFDVLEQGIKEGRKIFANTLKYLFMAISANFGNMFSMSITSLFLSFLPLLPKQILLTNLFTDIPELTISTDNVDQQLILKPQKWDIKFLRNFMIVFGLISSIFDFLTFGTLLWITDSISVFRTGWFIESVVSAATIVLVIRTRQSIFKSRPGKYLALSVLGIVIATFILPYLSIGDWLFSFAPLPLPIIGAIGCIVLLYAITAEYAKKIFYKKSG